MKFTPRKNAFTKGILGILVSVFFLSPISISLTVHTTRTQGGEYNGLDLSYGVSKVNALPVLDSTSQSSLDGGMYGTNGQSNSINGSNGSYNFSDPYSSSQNSSQSSTDGTFGSDPFGPNQNSIQGGLDGTTGGTDPNYNMGASGPISASTQSSAQTATADPKGSPTDQAGATTKNPPENGKTEQNKVIQFLGNILLGIGAFFAMLTGTLLDASLKHLVFEMGVMVNQNSFGGSITQMWTLLRDICNLLFIFGFIYLGIRTIIDPESATVKRTLARIIIGALLINFSLFIVKFVIDVSNFTALKIYQAMTDGTGSVTGAIMQIMGVSSFYSSDMKPVDFTNITTAGGLWFYVMGALMFIVIAVTFAIAAVMLIVRFAVLIFLMLGAPLLFAAPVFPQLESIASGLWKKLFSNAFFAPVYLLLVLISIKLMEGLVISMKGGILASQLGAPPTSVDAYSMVLNFLIIIFFLIQSLVIAQKMGAVGGDTAVAFGDKIRKGAQGYAGRGALRVGYGKYTVGGALDRLQKNTTSPTIARVAGSVTGAKFGSSRSYADTKKEDKEMEARKNRQTQVSNISTAASNSHKAEEEYNKVHAPGSGASQAQKDAARTAHDTAKMQLEQKMSNASTEQTLELLKKHNEKSPERKALLANLSNSQFDSLMKVDADKLDDGEKAKIRQQRSQAVQDRLIATENQKRHAAASAGGPAFAAASISDVIGKTDGKDLDALEFDKVIAQAGLLSSKQIDDMTLTTTAKARLKDARKTALIAEFAGGAGAASVFGRVKTEAEIAKLPGDILKDYGAARYLTQGVLTKMLDNDDIVDSTVRRAIKSNVETVWAADPLKTGAFKKYFKNTPAGQQYV